MSIEIIIPLALLTLAVAVLVWWNVRTTLRLFAINADCVAVMTATEKVLQGIETRLEGHNLELRIEIGHARDMILQKINDLKK